MLWNQNLKEGGNVVGSGELIVLQSGLQLARPASSLIP
jgi:hypothetical protein